MADTGMEREGGESNGSPNSLASPPCLTWPFHLSLLSNLSNLCPIIAALPPLTFPQLPHSPVSKLPTAQPPLNFLKHSLPSPALPIYLLWSQSSQISAFTFNPLPLFFSFGHPPYSQLNQSVPFCHPLPLRMHPCVCP